MAGIVDIRTSLQVRDTATGGTGNYQSKPTAFQSTVLTFKGPTPGVVAIAVTGTQVSFSQLSQPGFVRMMNLDVTNYVEYGIRDPTANKFYPLGELRAGESYVLRFSRHLLSDYYNAAGTGTDGDVNYFWMKANTAAVNVLVEAFES